MAIMTFTAMLSTEILFFIQCTCIAAIFPVDVAMSMAMVVVVVMVMVAMAMVTFVIVLHLGIFPLSGNSHLTLSYCNINKEILAIQEIVSAA